MAIIPCIIDRCDAVILDQQCHVSIQTAVQIVASKGVSLEIIRHSNEKYWNILFKKNKCAYLQIGDFFNQEIIESINKISN